MKIIESPEEIKTATVNHNDPNWAIVLAMQKVTDDGLGAYWCPYGYGECEDQGCCYPGRCSGHR